MYIIEASKESIMKLTDILNEIRPEDNRVGLKVEWAHPGLGSKFSQPTLDIKGNKIQFNLGIGANSDASGAIVLDFKPKGKKNLELYNNNIPDVVKEIEKWVTKKTKLPASQSQWSDPKNTVRIIVNANSILKKLK
tara:strand:+ start:614 stop:1021 length:408 start_codon:yes stop_codon:yes gene_type:complete